MIVVLDTNVLLQSIGKKSRHRPIWQALLDKKYIAGVSSFILLEYEEVIAIRASALASDLVQKIFLEAENIKHVNPDFEWDAISIDRDDNKFFDAAIAAGADYLVTNDGHFNEAKKLSFPSVNIISSDEFLEILNSL